MEKLQDINNRKLQESFSLLYRLQNNTEIKKSEEELEIEKGGVGSRGGKVIGYTKSGKPIYENRNPNHIDYKDFTKEDHEDAANSHHNHAIGLARKNESKFTKHLNKKDKHLVSAGKPGHWRETRKKQGFE